MHAGGCCLWRWRLPPRVQHRQRSDAHTTTGLPTNRTSLAAGKEATLRRATRRARRSSAPRAFPCARSTCSTSTGECAPADPGRPKLLITPIFHDLFRFFPVFPGTFGCAPWIPGVQALKMGEKWRKMGKKWVQNEITGLQKTALMHASAHLAGGSSIPVYYREPSIEVRILPFSSNK